MGPSRMLQSGPFVASCSRKRRCGITDADLVHLKAMPDLEVVFIIGQKKVTGEGLEHLAELKKLATIDLDGTPVEGKHLFTSRT